MPATEQTWYNQNTLNKVFGVSAVLLLVCTVWMLWSDHAREWKGYQREFRTVEAKVNSWRIAEQNSLAFQQSERDLEAKIEAAAALMPMREDVERTMVEVLYHSQIIEPSRQSLVPIYDAWKLGKVPTAQMLPQLQAGAVEATAAGEAKLRGEVLAAAEATLALIAEPAADGTSAKPTASPDQIRTARGQLINALDRLIRVVRFSESSQAVRKKFAVADQAVKDSNFGMGVRDSVSDEQLAALQADFAAEAERVAGLDLDLQRLTAYRKALELARRNLTAVEDGAKKLLADYRAGLAILEKVQQEKFGGWGRAAMRTLLEFPIIDAFGRPLKIEQIWLPELTQDFNFKRVARFDRCTTCHLGIDKTAPGSATDPAYPLTHSMDLVLQLPEAAPKRAVADQAQAVLTSLQALSPLLQAVTPSTAENAAPAAIKALDELRAPLVQLAELSSLLEDKPQAELRSALSTVLEQGRQAASQCGNAGLSGELQGKLAGIERSVEVINAAESPLAGLYGFSTAAGLFASTEIAVAEVRPGSPAAKAGLIPGDVVTHVDGSRMRDAATLKNALVTGPTWGETKQLLLTVTRGLPQPYASHPRLDLYVGSLSPHKLMGMGCTACHEGQGSATAFKYASHTPNSPVERKEWQQKYGWYDNHHWIYPMMANRFAESSCLKCHHGVTELEPSDKFPEPPAPKLMAGYHLIREYGCFGCHEINGYDGPSRRIGPDMRLEPNYSPTAQALLDDPGLSAQEKEWADRLIKNPTDSEARKRLHETLVTDAELAKRAVSAYADDAAAPRLKPRSHELASVLEESETPGVMRKVGPSLRYAAAKLDPTFLYRWLENTMNFRPTTKMPRFFGLHDHLTAEQAQDAVAREDIEMRAITHYLLTKSAKFEYTPVPAEVTQPGSAERGKVLFQTRCLSCHAHSDFPQAKADQGPDLSRMGGKLKQAGNTDGAQWLYSWLRNPSRYHARTFMPEMKLEVVTQADGSKTDAALDVTAYLLNSNEGNWQAAPVESWNAERAGLLDSMVFDYLKSATSTRSAERFVKDGIPEALQKEFVADEAELIGPPSVEKKLSYLGKRVLGKYGCYACHDIPGFEGAKPIGAALADWGRKDPSRIGFEHIAEYLHRGLAAHAKAGMPTAKTGQGDHSSTLTMKPVALDKNPAAGHAANGEHGSEHDAHVEIDTADLDPNVGYFVDAINSHSRIGFLWQKLREPRSYDFRKVENKPYNDRLRMPKFNFTDEQVESVMTFVLGLVADPPASKYVYRATGRRKAELEGLAVLQKYNCSGCHQLKHDEWKVAFEPSEVGEQTDPVDYHFLKPHFSPEAKAASQLVDRAGMLVATVQGRPVVREADGLPELVDEEYLPLEPAEVTPDTPAYYQFVLWKPTVLNGQTFRAGDKLPIIRRDRVLSRVPTWGGDLGRWIYPDVLATERTFNSAADRDQAWGWLPPPLMGEGKKVRPGWLHDYLLEPHLIRPSTILRMPKFNLSSEEAGKLVDYFAAVDGGEFPYLEDERKSDQHLALREAEHPGHLNQALNMVTSGDYCVKCHNLADYSAVGKPTAYGTDKAAAPDLSKVYGRLQSDYMRDWIGNPKLLLPYTGMPVNIAVDKPIAQTLYVGDSQEQLDALVDLLANFDQYARGQTKVKDRIKPAAPAASPASGDSAAAEVKPVGSASGAESLGVVQTK